MSTGLDIEALALDYAWTVKAHAEAADELERLSAKLSELRHDLRAHLSLGEAVDAGPHGWVVLTPPAKRLPARVDRSGVEAYAEQLMQLGLVREERTLSRPKVSDIRANAAALAAHGVPLDRILVEPVAQPTLEVVARDGGA